MILTSVAIILRVLSNPLGNVFQKQLTNRYNHPLLINFLTFLLLSVFCIIPAIQVRWLELPFEFWKYCILAGIVGATGNGFLVKALQCGDLSVLGPINSYKSVVGIIVGIFLLGEIPNLWGIAGMSLIVYGSYYVLDTMDEHFPWLF
jgi:drug/metabolite transporter (DMT)-like permease